MHKFLSGEYYDGGWLHDMKHGVGVLFDGEGNLYEGEFANDKRHGHGKLTFPGGAVLSNGFFLNDQLQACSDASSCNLLTCPAGQFLQKSTNACEVTCPWLMTMNKDCTACQYNFEDGACLIFFLAISYIFIIFLMIRFVRYPFSEKDKLLKEWLESDKLDDLTKTGEPRTEECVVCLENPRQVLLLPCKHMCVCVRCSVLMDVTSLTLTCPICRSCVQQKIRVFI
jgi:hypothetical protein